MDNNTLNNNAVIYKALNSYFDLDKKIQNIINNKEVSNTKELCDFLKGKNYTSYSTKKYHSALFDVIYNNIKVVVINELNRKTKDVRWALSKYFDVCNERGKCIYNEVDVNSLLENIITE
jgi:hypothetical protein